MNDHTKGNFEVKTVDRTGSTQNSMIIIFILNLNFRIKERAYILKREFILYILGSLYVFEIKNIESS